MKRYQFRLETIRRVRRIQEEVAKSSLAVANSEVQSAISVVEQRNLAYQDAISRPSSSADVDSFMRRQYFNDLAAQAVEHARAEQRLAEERAAQQRLAWMEAAKKVKVLDRLDDRRHEEYRIDFEREVTKEVDDIVIARNQGARPR